MPCNSAEPIPSLSVGPAPLLDNLSTVTVAAWINSGPASAWHSLIDKRNAHTNGFDLYLQPSSRLFLRANDTTLNGNAVVADNSWHHVVGIYDGDLLTLYVDGVLDASAPVGALNLVTSNPLQLGTGWNGGYFYTGRIDEVRIWNRALSAADVAEVYAFTGGPPPPDVTAPLRSGEMPTGTLPEGTTQTVISLTTDEAASCRYDTVSGTAYAAMTEAFATTGGTSHTTLLTGLVDGGIYDLHVRCEDTAGNANPATSRSASSSRPPAASPA